MDPVARKFHTAQMTSSSRRGSRHKSNYEVWIKRIRKFPLPHRQGESIYGSGDCISSNV